MPTEDTANKILFQAREIDRIVTQIDRGWIESEKVRNILKKYYAIRIEDIPEADAGSLPAAGTSPSTK
jgi:hypothetical protein